MSTLNQRINQHKLPILMGSQSLLVLVILARQAWRKLLGIWMLALRKEQYKVLVHLKSNLENTLLLRTIKPSCRSMGSSSRQSIPRSSLYEDHHSFLLRKFGSYIENDVLIHVSIKNQCFYVSIQWSASCLTSNQSSFQGFIDSQSMSDSDIDLFYSLWLVKRPRSQTNWAIPRGVGLLKYYKRLLRKSSAFFAEKSY